MKCLICGALAALFAMSVPERSTMAQAVRNPGEFVVYMNPIHKWSISYPAEWTLNDKSGGADFMDAMEIAKTPSEKCEVLAATPRPVQSLDELTDRVVSQVKASFAQLGVTVSRRRQVTLPDGVRANDVLFDIGSGIVAAKSRRIFAIGSDGRSYQVHCEASSGKWANVERQFDHILTSLIFSMGPPSKVP